MARKRNKKLKSPKINWKLVLALCALLIIAFSVFDKYYFLGLIDSTINHQETPKYTQRFIPEEVKREVEKQKKLFALTYHPAVSVPVLMYHYVEYVQDPKDTTRISLNTLPVILEEQVKTLKNAGYTFMTAGELGEVLTGKKELPKKPVVLTFDDSYGDFYPNAYPILKKYDAKATQYVISGYLDHPNHMRTSDLLKIAKDDLVEIGAHTVDHIWLKDESRSILHYEIGESRKKLEQKIGKKVLSFAYPYGAFDNAAIEEVRRAGFTNAVSTVPGIQQSFFQRFFIYRLRPGIRIGEELTSWLQSSKFSAF